jgi:hypothetical protein
MPSPLAEAILGGEGPAVVRTNDHFRWVITLRLAGQNPLQVLQVLQNQLQSLENYIPWYRKRILASIIIFCPVSVDLLTHIYDYGESVEYELFNL